MKKYHDAPKAIWWIDSFGNCKTTLLLEDIKLLNPIDKTYGVRQVQTKFGTLSYFPSLKNVPNEEIAIIMGSSGLGEKRFLEIVAQDVNGSAQKKFNASVGSKVV